MIGHRDKRFTRQVVHVSFSASGFETDAQELTLPVRAADAKADHEYSSDDHDGNHQCDDEQCRDHVTCTASS